MSFLMSVHVSQKFVAQLDTSFTKKVDASDDSLAMLMEHLQQLSAVPTLLPQPSFLLLAHQSALDCSWSFVIRSGCFS